MHSSRPCLATALYLSLTFACVTERAPAEQHERVTTKSAALAATLPFAPGQGATATRLSDGRVLIAGGCTGTTASAHAALVDPVAGSFASIPNMLTGRCGHTATLLPDGRVLLAGGYVGTSLTATANAEVFSPSTGSFTAVGNMHLPRAGHAAALLPSGRVLFLGGPGSGATVGELFDPATIVFTYSAAPTGMRPKLTLTTLGTGAVLAVSGGDAEIYTPATNSWRYLGATPAYRANHAATLLADGRVLVAGGDSVSGAPQPLTGDLFDPGTETWTSSAPRASASWAATLVAVPSGDALLFGGGSRVERFDHLTGTFARLAPLESLEGAPNAVLLPGGLVFVHGEQWGASLYDPSSPTCAPTTCATQGKVCGSTDDGCGGPLYCGNCAAGQTCEMGTCSACVPTWSCASQSLSCGSLWTGCETVSCGTCSAGQTCIAGTCTTTPSCTHAPCVTGEKLSGTCDSCAQKVCAHDAYCCNTAWDSLCVSEARTDCGGTCCTPTTCEAQGKTCGSIADSCGGTLFCGSCASGQTCNAGTCVAATPTACVHSPCVSGTKLANTCSTCAQTVCGLDSYCCNVAWDSQCVSEARSHCGTTCP